MNAFAKNVRRPARTVPHLPWLAAASARLSLAHTPLERAHATVLALLQFIPTQRTSLRDIHDAARELDSLASQGRLHHIAVNSVACLGTWLRIFPLSPAREHYSGVRRAVTGLRGTHRGTTGEFSRDQLPGIPKDPGDVKWDVMNEPFEDILRNFVAGRIDLRPLLFILPTPDILDEEEIYAGDDEEFSDEEFGLFDQYGDDADTEQDASEVVQSHPRVAHQEAENELAERKESNSRNDRAYARSQISNRPNQQAPMFE
jgi:hypothetical protein